MAFAQGTTPAVKVRGVESFNRLAESLARAGYVRHDGLKVERENELAAWVRALPDERQVHVQASIDDPLKPDPSFSVYAHTEPSGYGLRHLMSALRDEHDFVEGARVLRADLRRARWRR